MKTKLILLTAVLAVTAAQGAAKQNAAPLWAGDHPGSFMRRQTDPVWAYTSIEHRERMNLTPAQRAELESDKAEYNAYIDWARKQPKK